MEHLAGHAHREHAVREDRRVAGRGGGEQLIGMERVEVARRAGVLDDLGALQVLDDDRLMRVEPCQGRSGCGRSGEAGSKCTSATTKVGGAIAPSSAKYAGL
jgi:hypothetical protein